GERLTALSVAEATQSRSPGVSSVAFRARSPGLRFASLMDMDFAVSGPLVQRSRLVPGSCPSTRMFALRFLQTSPHGDSPCVVANPSPPSGWAEDFHLQATEHVQHTTELDECVPVAAVAGETRSLDRKHRTDATPQIAGASANCDEKSRAEKHTTAATKAGHLCDKRDETDANMPSPPTVPKRLRADRPGKLRSVQRCR